MVVHLDSYYQSSATAGWLEGKPTIDDVVNSAKSHLKKMWGDREDAVLVIPPEKPLGQRVHMAWLNSYTSVNDPEAHGSHLFVIWFQPDYRVDPLEAALAHVDANGGWNKHAKDWWM